MGAVSRYALSPEQRLRAFAAVDRFTPQPPLDDDGRAAILGAIAGVLNDQERDDLRAALERRPLVKHGLPPRDPDADPRTASAAPGRNVGVNR